MIWRGCIFKTKNVRTRSNGVALARPPHAMSSLSGGLDPATLVQSLQWSLPLTLHQHIQEEVRGVVEAVTREPYHP